MTSRFFGVSGAGQIQRAVAQSVVAARGRAVAERIERGVRLLDVVVEGAAETIPGCAVLRPARRDTAPLVGDDVLLLVLGDGRGVVLGVLQRGDETLTARAISEDDPDRTRGAEHGETDRVIEHAGSTIVLTGDGDIVLRPRRALRVEGDFVRIETQGEASDNPVALRPFIRWAKAVEAELQRIESWIALNSPFLKVGAFGPAPTIPPLGTPTIPDAETAALGVDRVRIPTGDV